MADKKISALTGAATPLAGSEVLPIVQSGATVKVSVDNLTAGKTVNTRNIIATVADDAYALAGNATTGNVRLTPYSAGYGSAALVAFSAGYAGYGPLTIDTSNTRFWQSGVEVFRTSANGLAPVAGKGIDFSAATHAAGMTSELLNDYEEGAWTPAVGGTWTVSPTALTGAYTKVGRQVTVLLAFTGGTKASAVSGYITGLPYATNYNGVGAVVDSDIGDRGQCLAANTDRVWLTGLTFSSGVNYATITYMV